MPRFTHARTAMAVALLASTAFAAPMAEAAQTCFTGFGGSVRYNFALASTKFVTAGTYAAPGVMFGSLSPCAGLSKWPLVGTVTVTASSVILAFRAMTVDAAGCGATDNIVKMTPTALTGTLQLHNDRNNFSNSTTFTVATCTAAPASIVAAAPMLAAPAKADGNGN